MNKLIITIGNVACGKTTYAMNWFAEDPQNRIIAERDAIRVKLFGETGFTKSQKLGFLDEQLVTEYQDKLIKDHLADNYSVIVPDTNLYPGSVTRFKEMAETFGASFEVVDMTDVPVAECMFRNARRPAEERIPPEVILRNDKRIKQMKKNHKVESRPLNVSSNKKNAIIFDLDGTVRLMNGRSPYASHLAHQDMPNVSVIMVIQGMKIAYPDLNLIAVSGADGNSRDVIVEQLDDFGITPDFLFVRKPGDNRKDSIVKEELYRQFIEPDFNVLFVLDDRTQVVDTWRKLGLHCFQVAPGDF